MRVALGHCGVGPARDTHHDRLAYPEMEEHLRRRVPGVVEAAAPDAGGLQHCLSVGPVRSWVERLSHLVGEDPIAFLPQASWLSDFERGALI